MILWLVACAPIDVAESIEVSIQTGPGLRDLEARVEGPVGFRWFEDGIETDFTSRIVPADRVWPGSTWRVEVLASDGRSGVAEREISEPDAGNVVVLLLDDVGVDKVGAYGGDWAAPTPRLDQLAAEGIRFTRAYASSVCSPTRGSLLTGLHPRRTGLGWVVDTGNRAGMLPLSELTIPEILRGARGPFWSTTALGKWHIAGPSSPDWLDHPNAQGFEHFAGAPGNPEYRAGRGYFHWSKNVNGVLSESSVYMTTDTANDVLDQLDTLQEPFFLYVGFNAPHGPLHVPPAELVQHPLGSDPTFLEQYDAMLEALDTEIGRIFDSMDQDLRARTTFIILGDNGTMGRGVPPEVYDNRHKHTPYEGGVNVPFIVTGPYVRSPGSVSTALIHVVDLLPTVAEIAGVPLAGPKGEYVVLEDGTWHLIDGRSLLPVFAGEEVRDLVYTEAYSPNGWLTSDRWQRALRSDTHKLIRWGNLEEFFRLEGPLEIDREPLSAWRFNAEDRRQLQRMTSTFDALEALGTEL